MWIVNNEVKNHNKLHLKLHISFSRQKYLAQMSDL